MLCLLLLRLLLLLLLLLLCPDLEEGDGTRVMHRDVGAFEGRELAIIKVVEVEVLRRQNQKCESDPAEPKRD